MQRHARTAVALIAACAALAFTAAPASAAPSWAPASSAKVAPGNMTFTNDAQCTSNFVFYDASNMYLGQAAHCSGTGGSTETDGCTSASLPLGTPVEVEGASKPGTLVYNSWLAMQKAGEKDPDTCAFNDLALIKLDPADAAQTNPSVPFWGGPTGLSSTGSKLGDKVLSYGNSSLRGGVRQLSPKEGTSLGSSAGGWTHDVYTVTPGIPGDSGSGFMTRTGSAFGVLSTVQLAPKPASNGVGDLSRELAYARGHGAAVTLATGTEPFRGPLLP
jgi:hypothetical protein